MGEKEVSYIVASSNVYILRSLDRFMPKTNELPLAAMERILKKGGADRVGEDGKAALRDVLEEVGMEIARKAKELCEHAGRKTIKAEDIKLAKR